MTEPRIRILIDDRERGSRAAEALLAAPGVDARYARLQLGDFEVDGRLRVERKTLHDFFASLQDGRLFRQAMGLANGGLPWLLVLEGRSSGFTSRGNVRSSMQGALTTLTLVMGVPILRSLDGDETARLVLYAARQLRRSVDGAVRRPGRRPTGKRRVQMLVLQGLPGVGPKRARSLLERFGSLQAVFGSSEEDLREVPGIGKRSARNIRWIAQEQRVHYTSR